MTAIAKSAKTHPTAKKSCGWEEPAIWKQAELSWGSVQAETVRPHRQTESGFMVICLKLTDFQKRCSYGSLKLKNQNQNLTSFGSKIYLGSKKSLSKKFESKQCWVQTNVGSSKNNLGSKKNIWV